MGLFDFLNKKVVDPIPTPAANNLNPIDDLDIPADFPSLELSNTNANLNLNMNNNTNTNIDSISAFPPASNNNSNLPQLTIPAAIPQPLESKSLSVNVPTLDFSMPPSDDISDKYGATNLGTNGSAYLDVDDLKKLFMSDNWQEPDWNNFEPYKEDKIEEPKISDFGQDLPNFKEEEQVSEIISEPASIEKSTIVTPVELFVREKEYNKAFLELDQISKSINKIDSRLGNYEAILRREESLYLESKNQMEQLYKRLTSIDKRIFAQ